AITTHTGGLAGEARVFSAVLRAHRAIEVADMDEMTEVLACAQGERWPRGRRLCVMTASGGQAELILDVAAAAGLSLPPLSATSVLGADSDYDAVVQCSDTCDDQPMGSVDRMLTYARSLTDAAAKSSKPCYFMTTRSGVFHREVITFLRQHGIALIGGTRQGL